MIGIIILLIVVVSTVSAQDDPFLDSSFSGDVSGDAAEITSAQDSMDGEENESSISDSTIGVDSTPTIKRMKKPDSSIAVTIQEQMSYRFPRNDDSPFYLEDAWDDDGLYTSPWFSATSVHTRASFFFPGRYVGLVIDNAAYFYTSDVYEGDSLEDKHFALANNVREAYLKINPISWWSFSFGKQIVSYGNTYFGSPINYLQKYFTSGYAVERIPPETGIYLYSNSFYAPWFTISINYIPDFSTELEEFSDNMEHAMHAALEVTAFYDFNPVFLLYTDGEQTKLGAGLSGGIGSEIIIYTDMSLEIFPDAPQFIRQTASLPLVQSLFVPIIEYTDIRDMDDLAFVGVIGINYTPASLFTILLEVKGNTKGLFSNEWDDISDELDEVHRAYQTFLPIAAGNNLLPLLNGYVANLHAADNAFQPRTLAPMLVNLRLFRDNVLRFSTNSLGFAGDITYFVFDNSFVAGAEVEWTYHSTLELAIRGEYSYGKEGSMVDSLLYPGNLFLEVSLLF